MSKHELMLACIPFAGLIVFSLTVMVTVPLAQNRRWRAATRVVDLLSIYPAFGAVLAGAYVLVTAPGNASGWALVSTGLVVQGAALRLRVWWREETVGSER